jgi:hypothetical protein
MPAAHHITRPAIALSPHTTPPEPPSLVDMLGGAVSFAGGLVAWLLPFILLSVPALLLVIVPLAVAAIPLALLGALLATPFLLVRAVRRDTGR